MPKFYCDYCDIYLTHSSTNGRKQHRLGRKHINNKIDHYKKVIKTPGFSPPLMFDSEYNVIGHLGNVRQFILNNEKHHSTDKRHQCANENKNIRELSSKPSSLKTNKHFNNGTNNMGGNFNAGQERFQHGKNMHGGNPNFVGYGRQEHSNYSNYNGNNYRGNQGDGGSSGSGGGGDYNGYRPYKKGHIQNFPSRY